MIGRILWSIAAAIGKLFLLLAVTILLANYLING